MFVALLTLVLAQEIEFNVANPFEHARQVGCVTRAYGDWNRDGHADFLASAPLGTREDGRATVALVSGKDGHGLIVWRVAGYASELEVVSDLDGDKRPEIVIGTFNRVRIYSSIGGALVRSIEGCQPVVVPDVDGDGESDLLINSVSIDDNVASFRTDIVAPKSGERIRTLFNRHDRLVPRCVGLPDCNGDGQGDIAVVWCRGVAGEHSLAVEIVSGASCDVLAKRSIETGFESPGFALECATDLDGDHRADIALSLFDPYSSDPTSSVLLLSGHDLKTLRELHDDEAHCEFGKAVACGADINGDGTNDVLVTEFANAFVCPTKAYGRIYSGRDGTLLRKQLGRDDFGVSASFIGDVDGDGTADYAIGNTYVQEISSEPGYVEVFSGKSGERLLRLPPERR